MPYPGYVLPDDAPLSDLVPPAAVRNDHVPEPPTSVQEHDGPMTPVEAAPFSASMPSKVVTCQCLLRQVL